MINLYANTTAIKVSTIDISFISAGITAANTASIFEDLLLYSYIPGEDINPVMGFTTGRGYFINVLQDMWLPFLISPLQNINEAVVDTLIYTSASGATEIVDTTNLYLRRIVGLFSFRSVPMVQVDVEPTLPSQYKYIPQDSKVKFDPLSPFDGTEKIQISVQ